METGGRRAHRRVAVGLPPAAAESGQGEEAAPRSHTDSGPDRPSLYPPVHKQGDWAPETKLLLL